MIKLVIVKNPFQPWKGREIKSVPNGFSLRQAVDMTEYKGREINCVVNGKVIEISDNYMIPDDDIVVLSPMVAKGGKSILSIVAMIGLSIAVGGILAGGLKGIWGAAFAKGAWGAYALAATTMFIGSTLIGKLTAVKADTGSNSSENDQTYSWSGVQTMEGQNNPIVMTYGKVKSGGQTIGKNITVDDNKEYLNWLVAAGEGPLEITDIQLNNNPTSYYEGVEIETREGTNNQEIIPYFNDTYFTKNIGYILNDNSERIDTAQGNATEKIIVKIEFSQGLYYAKDDGNLGDAWVDVAGWYRLKNTTEWLELFNSRVTGSQSSAIRKEYSSEKLAPGEYEVKVKVTGRQYSDTSSRASVKCWWTSLTSVVYDDFTYPNIALIGIKALATDQLNGTPSLSFIKERAKVWVWNPYLESYEEKPANNPAWAAYDMLHLCNKIKNINTNEDVYEVRGASKDLLIYDQFNEWASFCTSMDLQVNIEITQAGELLETINQNIANCGRGIVVRFGTRYGCVWDAVKQPVQMFGMGNIISGTFKEEFLQRSDRANCVEITYNDSEMDYERNTITIYSDSYDDDPEEKTAQSTYNGITSYEQAYREGKYQLYCNKYLLRTVSFEANVDAIACTIGDVILVAHDVPKWAYSGRIYAVDIAKKQLTLPVEIEDTSKSYRVMFRTVKDTLVTTAVTVVSNANGWCTVQCADAFSTSNPPQANDIFDLAITEVGSKPFVVKSISRSSDFVRQIECLEYNENVYSENYDIPPIDYSRPEVKVSNVTNLRAKQSRTIDDNGVYQYLLETSWDYGAVIIDSETGETTQKAGTFSVYGSYDGYNFIPLATGISERSYSNLLQNQLTYIRVVTRNGMNSSSGVTVEVDDLDIMKLPECKNVRAYTKYREFNDSVVRYDIVVEWDVPTFGGYQQAQVWYKINNGRAISGIDSQGNEIGVAITNGLKASEIGAKTEWLYGGQGYSNVIIPQAIVGDTYSIVVCTQDTLGNTINPDSIAAPYTIVVSEKSETPDTPNNVGTKIDDNGFTVFWDPVRNADIKYYEVRLDTSLGAETSNFIGRTTDTKLITTSITNRNSTLYVFAVSAYSKASAPAVIEYHYGKPVAPVITLEAKLQGIQCQAAGLPVNCHGVHWYFENGSDITDAVSNNVTYYYSCQPAVYSVYACYRDYFGDGLISARQLITVKQYIDANLLEEGSLGANLLNESTQQALAQAVSSIQPSDLSTWWNGEKGNYYTSSQTDSKIQEGLVTYVDDTVKSYVETKTSEAVEQVMQTISPEGVLKDYATQNWTSNQINSSVATINTTTSGLRTDLTSVQQTATSINNIATRLSELASTEAFNDVKKSIHNTLTVGQAVTWSASSTSLEFYVDVKVGEVYSVSLFGGNSSSWKVWFTDNNNKVLVRGCVGLTSTATTGKNGDNDKLTTSSSTTNWTKISDTVTVPKNNNITRMWLFTRCDSNQTTADVSKWASVQKTVYSAITQLADGISLSVTGTSGRSSIDLTQGTLTLNTDLLQVGREGAMTSIADGAIKTKMLDAKCVTADKIEVTDLSAITGTFGTFETLSNDKLGKVIISGGLIEVYSRTSVSSSTWVLRVRLGIWS